MDQSMRTMTLQDDGVPGAGSDSPAAKRPCPHWLRDIVRVARWREGNEQGGWVQYDGGANA